MASEVTWYEEGKIILVRNTDLLSVEDVLKQSNQLMTMMSAADHKISIIDDFSGVPSINPKLALLPFTSPQALRLTHYGTLDILAMVGMSNTLAAYAFEAVVKFSKTIKTQKFSTVAEAADWLRAVESVRQSMQSAQAA